MTATSTATGVAGGGSVGGTRRGGKVVLWLAVIVALILVAVVAGSPKGDNGQPFDPAFTDPSGSRALVMLLEGFGAQVSVTSDLPGPDVDVALMFYDVVPEGDEPEVEEWVREGGTLVVVDPFSVWAPRVANQYSGIIQSDAEVGRGACDVESLDDLSVVTPGMSVAAFEVPAGAQRCFTAFGLDQDGGAFVTSTPLGAGQIVAVGSPYTFANEHLDTSDNAALATGLLLPETVDGADPHVAILQLGDEEAATEDRDITDAMSTGAKLAVLQLLIAFLAYAWYRARRVGRPITEPQPVAVAGSELVTAVGQLLQQTHDPNRAARALRADLRRQLGERFGLGASATPEALTGVVAERSGIDPQRLYAIVSDQPVTTDRELVELAETIDDVRKEILHGP